MVQITDVEAGSPAEAAGILPGDILDTINQNEIRDVLDYRYYLAEEKVELGLRRDQKPFSVVIRKETYSDIGLSFPTPLMDQKHSCRNKCIFCFIDQLPKGLRPSLYFKDDDSRLSFLHGNYITLTNMEDRDIDRIIKMRFSPVNISIHTTNPELRVRMMKNKRAGEVLSYIRRIADAGLRIHGQIVLCKGYNDGEELRRTMRDLSEMHESIDSVSVVPAGLTRFRDKLTPLSPFTPEECRQVIADVNAFGDRMKQMYGNRIFACADELYITAGIPLPEAEYYEDYPQIENGVGMLTSMQDEIDEWLKELSKDPSFTGIRRQVSLATGTAAYEFFLKNAEKIHMVFPGVTVKVYRIINHFFGEKVTVAGLLTGQDLWEQLQNKPLGEALLLSRNCIRNEEELFLCGMTRKELEERLQVPVVPNDSDGASFLTAVFGRSVTD